MIGHIKPDKNFLSQNTRREYDSLYCSLCASLRKNMGFTSCLFINSELTMLLLGMREFFIPKETKSMCVVNPLKLRYIYSHPIIDKAAEFSYLLVYIKMVDSKADEYFIKKHFAGMGEAVLRKKSKKIIDNMSENMKKIIEEYIAITKNDSTPYEIVIEKSGVLTGEIAREIGKEAKIPQDIMDISIKTAYLIGKMVTIADPLVDFTDDKTRGKYNPILALSKNEKNGLNESYEIYLEKYREIEKEISKFIEENEKKMNKNFITCLKLAVNGLNNKIIGETDKVLGKNITENFRAYEVAKIADCDCGGCDGCGDVGGCNHCDCGGHNFDLSHCPCDLDCPCDDLCDTNKRGENKKGEKNFSPKIVVLFVILLFSVEAWYLVYEFLWPNIKSAFKW